MSVSTADLCSFCRSRRECTLCRRRLAAHSFAIPSSTRCISCTQYKSTFLKDSSRLSVTSALATIAGSSTAPHHIHADEITRLDKYYKLSSKRTLIVRVGGVMIKDKKMCIDFPPHRWLSFVHEVDNIESDVRQPYQGWNAGVTYKTHIGDGWYVTVNKTFDHIDIRRFYMYGTGESNATRVGIPLTVSEWTKLYSTIPHILVDHPNLSDSHGHCEFCDGKAQEEKARREASADAIARNNEKIVHEAKRCELHAQFKLLVTSKEVDLAPINQLKFPIECDTKLHYNCAGVYKTQLQIFQESGRRKYYDYYEPQEEFYIFPYHDLYIHKECGGNGRWKYCKNRLELFHELELHKYYILSDPRKSNAIR